MFGKNSKLPWVVLKIKIANNYLIPDPLIPSNLLYIRHLGKILINIKMFKGTLRGLGYSLGTV